jgi:hypothetical protein
MGAHDRHTTPEMAARIATAKVQSESKDDGAQVLDGPLRPLCHPNRR